jgi:hypothetical protein
MMPFLTISALEKEMNFFDMVCAPIAVCGGPLQDMEEFFSPVRMNSNPNALVVSLIFR